MDSGLPSVSGVFGELYKIGLLPIYCEDLAFASMPVAGEGVESIPRRASLRRLAVVAAGPIGIFVFASGLFALLSIVGTPVLIPVIGKVQEGLPAEAAGLRKGDRIVSVDGRGISSRDELAAEISGSLGRPLEIRFARGPMTGLVIVRPTV